MQEFTCHSSDIKGFMPDEMFLQNASKFAIFLKYDNYSYCKGSRYPLPTQCHFQFTLMEFWGVLTTPRVKRNHVNGVLQYKKCHCVVNVGSIWSICTWIWWMKLRRDKRPLTDDKKALGLTLTFVNIINSKKKEQHRNTMFDLGNFSPPHGFLIPSNMWKN